MQPFMKMKMTMNSDILLITLYLSALVSIIFLTVIVIFYINCISAHKSKSKSVNKQIRTSESVKDAVKKVSDRILILS